jgi:alcohol-forming fatty acyl-CoA reductase
LSWQAEVAAARRLRGDAEAASREPANLARFRAEARRELGAAGAPALAAKTESLRDKWVRDRLIEAGRARAASVGWPDAYAFTKALGEQALSDSKGDVPVSIVRPSIIESAWAEPRPGWIRGFRMAEPVLISYARGLLREFPGVPEGIVDVIPVDLVVAAIISVAALGPDEAPEICQVASGGINPLRYRTLVDNVSGWFTEHPLYDPDGQPIVVPEFRFPGRGRVQAQLTRAKSMITRGEKFLQTLPLRGKQAELAARLETKRMEVERALEYVELYGLYTECEAIYQVDRLLDMWQRLGDADQAAFAFDPRALDWPTYIREIHLPSIVQHARVKTVPGRTRTDRTARLRRQVLSPDRHVAAFDLENTLIASNVVESYSWLATRRLDGGERVRYALRTLAEAPGLLKLDRIDRGDFLRHFYRRYENAPVSQIETDARELLTHVIVTKSFPAGLRRVREHRELGHRTILITGALDFAVDGLRPLFDEIIAAEMSVRPDGTYSGELLRVPPTGETRAQILADYCAAEGLKLEEAVAYADSTSDLPLLEAVGFPVAVNPETRLAAIARKRGWLVEQWSKASGGPRPLLPIGPLMVERERRRRFA